MYEQNDSFATGYAVGRDSSGYNNGMFGGEWAWIILLLLFGWGGFGFGGFGGFGMGGFGMGGPMMGFATQADIQRGFDNNAVMNKLNGIENGLCDGFYALNTGLLTGFNGVNTAISNLGFQTQQCLKKFCNKVKNVFTKKAVGTCMA